MDKQKLYTIIEEKAPLLTDLSDKIWEYAELSMLEYKSTAAYVQILTEEGFEVTEKLCNMPTAFSGAFGSGKPVIGILGEYDALSGLSQAAGVAEKMPLEENGCGQGCGHNLLGAGALGAAIAIKEAIKAGELTGTVIFYGCPGEEGCAGKTFMARDGIFAALDAAITWHPGDTNEIMYGSNAACMQVEYTFTGIAAHAAGNPWSGRSALDAAELMNVGVQFLREHIPSSCRIHYAITNAGGFSPNVVQAHAEVLYLIRGVNNQIVAELYDRVNDIAKGAALMTGTKESHQFIKACSNTIPNDAMQYMLQEKMERIPSPEPTAEEWEYARKLTLESLSHVPVADPDHPLWWEVSPYEPEKQEHGSTDVGDVSWVCPTAQIYTACVARGTPGHSWQQTAQSKTTFARAMTIYAAKVLAAGAVEMLTNPELLEQAKAEHRKRVGPAGYVPPIPKDIRPISMDALRK